MSAPLTPEQRQAWRRLADAATQGEWDATAADVWRIVEGRTPVCCNRPQWSGNPADAPECCGQPDYPPEQELIARAGDDATAAYIAHSSPDRVRALLDALEAAEQRQAWQPIETAPTNQSVLIYIPNAEHYGDGIYRAILVDMGTGRRWMTIGLHVGRDICGGYEPTHWQPLPLPPQESR